MDDFEELIKDLDSEIDTSDVVDMTKLTIEELLTLYAEETESLMDAGQAIRPRTQDARDRQSLRYAARMELDRRMG